MTFQQENNLLLKNILEERFFKHWRQPYDATEKTLQSEASLELYLTSLCDQHCEYCYLVKYPDLYPAEVNKPEIIKKNLKILYNWIIENNFYIPQIDFFTGEIWASKFGWDVLEITLDALARGAKLPYFLVPSNCSFCLSEEKTMKIQHYIEEFKKYGSCLQFSISIDGKILDNESRPLVNTNLIKTDEYYERIFLFAQHNNFKFHPMVAANSVHKWIENYKWWEQELAKYPPLHPADIMMLEVRNNNWGQESMDAYNAFMKFLIDNDIQKFSNIETFIENIFNFRQDIRINDAYVPYWPSESITFAPCTIPSQLTVRVGDLSLPPCHRTAYNKLLYGRFITQDNKIIDIEANNVYTAQRILLGNTKTVSFKCDGCVLNDYCLKGCFGEQWEDNADPFMPSTNVCWFFEEKWKFLVGYFYDLGIVKICKEKYNPFFMRYPMIKSFIDFCERVNDHYGLGKS